MSARRFRPPDGHEGSIERSFRRTQYVIEKALETAQRAFVHEALRLDRGKIKALAAILVEFAEDLHCDIGMWRTVERYNQQFFGTPLPFVTEPVAALAPDEISPARLQHFLWVLYPQLIPDLVFRPDNDDLVRLSQAAAEVLGEQFANLPKDSGVKSFLSGPDDEGWEVKQKLVWLGTKSYLVRIFFDQYMRNANPQDFEIAVVDDFLAQECTEWAGLGAIEILAGVLELPAARRAELLSWTERHNALFRVLSVGEGRIELLNLINRARYRVRLSMPRHPFVGGDCYIGKLVPWDGEWCWSGEQRGCGPLDAAAIEQIKQHYQKLPSLYYRYHPRDLETAREMTRKQYGEFVARHGSDWVAFPDGFALAAEMKKEAEAKFAALKEHERKEFLKRHGLEAFTPSINIANEVLESTSGIAAYFNPQEGLELIMDFDAIRSGLRKKGVDLSADEQYAINRLVKTASLSPGFARRLVDEHGIESIAATVGLENRREGYVLDYLLRRFSGRYYRPRYPTMRLAK